MLIGDVGQGEREEVDYAVPPDPGRGLNLGWDCREGLLVVPPPNNSGTCDGASGFTDPIFEYENPESAQAAIVGGYVVRDPSLGDLYGRYLFTDSYDGTIRSLLPQLPAATGVRQEGLSVEGPSSFGEDACGRVYVASLGTGEVSRFDGDAPGSCARAAAAAPRRGVPASRRPGSPAPAARSAARRATT